MMPEQNQFPETKPIWLEVTLSAAPARDLARHTTSVSPEIQNYIYKKLFEFSDRVFNSFNKEYFRSCWSIINHSISDSAIIDDDICWSNQRITVLENGRRKISTIGFPLIPWQPELPLYNETARVFAGVERAVLSTPIDRGLQVPDRKLGGGRLMFMRHVGLNADSSLENRSKPAIEVVSPIRVLINHDEVKLNQKAFFYGSPWGFLM
jgi:hypothetical protein